LGTGGNRPKPHRGWWARIRIVILHPFGDYHREILQWHGKPEPRQGLNGRGHLRELVPLAAQLTQVLGVI
jgi:hypothetical protein